VLTLTFLGVGSAFAKRNFQSNALVEAWSFGPQAQTQPDDTLLIDFGGTGPLALFSLKGHPGFGYMDHHGLINYPAIRRVFITHLHSDHIGGLEELATINRYQYIDPPTGRGFRSQLIGASEVIDSLWNHSLRGGLGAHAGGYAELSDYFDMLPLPAVRPDAWKAFTMLDRYEFNLLPTDHIQIHRKYDWPSFGLSIRDVQTGQKVVYTGDTRFDPDGLGPALTNAKLVFHDVQLEDQPQPVHALLSQLRTLPRDIRKKTILYHYADRWDDGSFAFVATEFSGFAKPHYRYVLFP